MMTRKTTILIILLAATLTCVAQVKAKDDSSRVDFHMSVGGAVMGFKANSFSQTQALTWVAPWMSYRATDRLTLHGGFVAAGSLLPNNFQLQGRGDQSLSPRREGTRAGALWAAADYKANDHLRIWAAVAMARGWMQPLWANESQPLAATAVDGGFAYRFDSGSVLAMHFRFVNDQYGTLFYPPYCGYPYYVPGYRPLAPSWELYSGHWPYWN